MNDKLTDSDYCRSNGYNIFTESKGQYNSNGTTADNVNITSGERLIAKDKHLMLNNTSI